MRWSSLGFHAARSAVPLAAFARMQSARQDFGTLTSSATVLTPREAGGPWTAASIAALYKASIAVRAEACRVRLSSGDLDGDAESLGGRGGVGIGGVLCAPESGDSRRSPRAADKPPLKGPRRATPEALGLRRASPLAQGVPIFFPPPLPHHFAASSSSPEERGSRSL